MKNYFLGMSLVFVQFSAQAFILVSPDYKLANPKATVVNIASQTCPAVGFPNSELRQVIIATIDTYWNTVTESKLHLEVGEEVARTTFAELVEGEILVGCKSSGGGNGGTTNPDTTKGASIILLDQNIYLSGVDYVKRVLAHEMGHAIGLAHSGDKASVMTYESHNWFIPSNLAQDDKNGVIYLYPSEAKVGGLVPGCEVKASGGHNNKNGATAALQEFSSIIFIILVYKLLLSAVAKFRRKNGISTNQSY